MLSVGDHVVDVCVGVGVDVGVCVGVDLCVGGSFGDLEGRAATGSA